ncbi:MAG: RluA family pseudouridine synthase [Bdellovibrio sp.]|nr:RluA family pseudouridine synthase [Bdellovibrio sp.]
MANTTALSPQLLAETSQWLVFFKPSGWLTIPGRKSQNDPTPDFPVLSDWVKTSYGPVWTVHRLDLHTSGVILFAKTSGDHQLANDWFENRKVKKRYIFLASGSLKFPVVKVNEPIEGKRCVTQIESLEKFGDLFLGAAIPLTGRRHQIRIHLAKEGHPILGDALYGGRSEHEGCTFNRVALHAQKLELPDGVYFEAPLPEDFMDWLTHLRGKNK